MEKVKKVMKMARRKRRRGGKSLVRTAEKFMGVMALAYPGVTRGKAVYDAEHDAIRAIAEGMGVYAGFQDGNFDIGRAIGAWTPFIAFNGLRGIAHKINSIIRGL